MNVITDIILGAAGGCAAFIAEHLVARVRLKLAAKKELKKLRMSITDQQMKDIAKEAQKVTSLPPEAKQFLSDPPDSSASPFDAVRLELQRPGGTLDQILDQILDEKLKTAEGAKKILGYAAAYLRDRAKEYKETDQSMLRRIERVCRAGEMHLTHLTEAAPKKETP